MRRHFRNNLRHSRESGNPASDRRVLDSSFRGNDEIIEVAL
jgi:hypothetical protein